MRLPSALRDWALGVTAAALALSAIMASFRYVRTGHGTGAVSPASLNIPGARLRDLARRGRARMARQRVVMGALVRDNAPHLATVARLLMETGEQFADHCLVFFENDSVDGSQDVLADLARAQPGRVLVRSVHLRMDSAISLGSFHASRFHKLAHFRSELLEWMQRVAEARYGWDWRADTVLMLVDADMSRGWHQDGFAATFGHAHPWDVACGNGVVNDGQHWDSLALRSPRHPNTLDRLQRDNSHYYFRGADLVPVYSCFGGLALYNASAIGHACDYAPSSDCEHVALHRCIASRAALLRPRTRSPAGADERPPPHGIFVNPALLLWYGAYEGLVTDSVVRAVVVSVLRGLAHLSVLLLVSTAAGGVLLSRPATARLLQRLSGRPAGTAHHLHPT